jgi:hypothetical protein
VIGGISTTGRGSSMTPEQAADRLGQFGDAISNPVNLQAALMAGGLLIENRWKQLIRERFFETGTYMRSVHMEPGEQHRGFAEVLLGTDIVDDPYPFYGEFGTSRMTARPTARPAMDEEGDNAFAQFVEAMDAIGEGILE